MPTSIHSSRARLGFLIGSLVLLGGLLDGASEATPRFLGEPLFAPPITQIRSIESYEGADVVYLDTGHAGGLRLGMLLEVWRGNEPVAELILVAARLSSSAALITSLGDEIVLETGDYVQIKLQNL